MKDVVGTAFNTCPNELGQIILPPTSLIFPKSISFNNSLINFKSFRMVL